MSAEPDPRAGGMKYIPAATPRLLGPSAKRIRRGSFHSIVDLQAALKHYLDERNATPKPFVWTASAASITPSWTDCLEHPNESEH
jgi:hypothetical protein